MKIPFLELFYLLTIITIFHELGHFLTAKYFKLNITEFAIGSGPAIFKQKFGNTEVILNMVLPLGGHIRVDFAVNEFKKMKTDKVVQMVLVALAGPMVNIVFAFLTYKYFLFFAVLSLLTGLANLIPADGSDGDIALSGTKEYLKRKRK